MIIIAEEKHKGKTKMENNAIQKEEGKYKLMLARTSNTVCNAEPYVWVRAALQE